MTLFSSWYTRLNKTIGCWFDVVLVPPRREGTNIPLCSCAIILLISRLQCRIFCQIFIYHIFTIWHSSDGVRPYFPWVHVGICQDLCFYLVCNTHCDICLDLPAVEFKVSWLAKGLVTVDALLSFSICINQYTDPQNTLISVGKIRSFSLLMRAVLSPASERMIDTSLFSDCGLHLNGDCHGLHTVIVIWFPFYIRKWSRISYEESHIQAHYLIYRFRHFPFSLNFKASIACNLSFWSV